MSLKNREGQGQGQQLQPWCSPGLPGWRRALSRAGIRQLPQSAFKEQDKLQERHPTAPSVSPRSLPWLWVTLPWPASTVSIHTRQAPAPPSTQPAVGGSPACSPLSGASSGGCWVPAAPKPQLQLGCSSLLPREEAPGGTRAGLTCATPHPGPAFSQSLLLKPSPSQEARPGWMTDVIAAGLPELGTVESFLPQLPPGTGGRQRRELPEKLEGLSSTKTELASRDSRAGTLGDTAPTPHRQQLDRGSIAVVFSPRSL